MIWKDLSKEKRVELVKAAWTSNGSAATIAQKISEEIGQALSRNSVIGFYTRNPQLALSHPLGGGIQKSRRVKWNPDGTKVPHKRRAMPKAKPTRKNKYEKLAKTAKLTSAEPPRKVEKVHVAAAAKAYDEASPRIGLMDLHNGVCRWPVHDPEPRGEHLFCGHAVPTGKRYCTHHLRRSTL